MLCPRMHPPTHTLAMLHRVKALWAAGRGQALTQCRELLSAGLWQDAHVLLQEQVAPQLLLHGRWGGGGCMSGWGCWV